MVIKSFLDFVRRGASFVLPLFVLFCLPVMVGATPLQEEGSHQAGIVIMHGDGQVSTRCVHFNEPQITGLTLLQRSGFDWVQTTGPIGNRICTLDNEGCPADDCFCQCKASPCIYWNYYHANPDGAWAYSGIGAAGWQITDGNIDAWVWGDGSQVPPSYTITDICAESASPVPVTDTVPTNTPTSQPTASPTQIPTHTATTTPVPQPQITETTSPTDTPNPPTATPVPTATPDSTVISTPLPTETSEPTPIQTTLPEENTSPDSSPANYVFFGVILLIVVTIGWFSRRK